MIDGRKNNKGVFKKPEDKKVAITIYKPRKFVAIVGGLAAARTTMSAAFDNEVYSHTQKNKS